MTANLKDNLNRVQTAVADACARAGRSPDEVTLVAVTKTHPPAVAIAAAEAGVQHLGENRVEEGETKIPQVTAAVAAPLTWHMIGHVQSRKAKDVPPLFQVVHSVDSLRLAAKLAARAAETGATLDVFLEMNVSGEASKYGMAAAAWQTDPAVRAALWHEVGTILALPGLRVRGLMTVAPLVEHAEAVRPVFAALARLRAALSETTGAPLADLSMGMTDDYPVAIEEGATVIRVGRALFGERIDRIEK